MREATERVRAAVRALPRTLREDLLTPHPDPSPRGARPVRPGWRRLLVGVAVLLAVALALTGVNELYHDGIARPLGLPLGLAQVGALLLAPYRPLAAWWAVTGVAVLAALASTPASSGSMPFPWTTTGMIAQAGVLYFLALRLRTRAAVEALAITLLVGLARVGTASWPTPGSDVAPAVLLLVTVVVVGTSLRGRRLARAALVVQAELTAGERARRTVLEERHRIARELHDVVAHHMTVISIQAQAAPHLVEHPTAELTESLAGIRQNAVEALAELRRVLGVLRAEDARADHVRHAPQPTLDQLDELLANVRATGLHVDVETAGEPRALPPGVALSAFRIVQEALSNAMRHAPGARARVLIGYHAAGLTVRVTNTAPDRPATAHGGGHGLLGMRERAAMLGGELATGATPDGGYEVLATLPLQEPA